MKKIILSAAIIALAVFSCKKDKKTDDPVILEKKVSWWVINGDTIKAPEINRFPGSSLFTLFYSSNNSDTTFTVQINSANQNIGNDSFPIFDDLDRPNSATAIFAKSVEYAIGPKDSGTYVYSTIENGKIKLRMPPTIFRKLIAGQNGRNDYSEDTTIIQGVFYEP